MHRKRSRVVGPGSEHCGVLNEADQLLAVGIEERYCAVDASLLQMEALRARLLAERALIAARLEALRIEEQPAQTFQNAGESQRVPHPQSSAAFATK